jgi:hypothetical protein
VKKLGQCHQLLFTGTEKDSKLASILCKIRGENHLRAFVTVAEGTEVYKFGINIMTHFSSKFWRNFWLNSARPKQNHAGTRAPATWRTDSARAHARVADWVQTTRGVLPHTCAVGRPMPSAPCCLVSRVPCSTDHARRLSNRNAAVTARMMSYSTARRHRLAPIPRPFRCLDFARTASYSPAYKRSQSSLPRAMPPITRVAAPTIGFHMTSSPFRLVTSSLERFASFSMHH